MTEKLPWVAPKMSSLGDLQNIAKVWVTPVVEVIKMNMSFVMSGPGVKPCGCPPGPCQHYPAGYSY